MTKEQIKAFLTLIEAVREAIEAAGTNGIPSGHLYAMLMTFNVSLAVYEKAVGLLIEAGRVKRSGHLLTAV